MTANEISDICYSYKYALSRPEMIKILSELYLCSREEIKNILRHNGFEIAERKKRLYADPWTADEDTIISHCMANGIPYKLIQIELKNKGYNRTYSAVQNRMKKIRENQKCGKF